MKVCIPVIKDEGKQSAVSPHFGSAPLFMIADTESDALRAIKNDNMHHAHGMCNPLKTLAGETFDCMVVGGIGMGAFSKLKAAGIEVYLSDFGTVEETVNALKAGKLRKVNEQNACGHNGRGHQH